MKVTVKELKGKVFTENAAPENVVVILNVRPMGGRPPIIIYEFKVGAKKGWTTKPAPEFFELFTLRVSPEAQKELVVDE